jgi:hypothetical protein
MRVQLPTSVEVPALRGARACDKGDRATPSEHFETTPLLSGQTALCGERPGRSSVNKYDNRMSRSVGRALTVILASVRRFPRQCRSVCDVAVCIDLAPWRFFVVPVALYLPPRCPCRPFRRTGRHARGASGAYWCWPNRSRRSARRRRSRASCAGRRPSPSGSSRVGWI